MRRLFLLSGLLFGLGAQAQSNAKTTYEFEKKIVEVSPRKSSAHPEAKYQEAWASFSSGRMSEALDSMKSAYVGASRGSSLSKDALLDLVYFYSWSTSAKGAVAFFSFVAADELLGGLLGLARSYSSQGKYDDAAAVYRELLASQPAKEHFVYQYELCLAVLSTNLFVDDSPLIELKSLLATYQKMPEGEPRKAARESARQLIREIAIVWHEAGRKTKNIVFYERAEKLYAAYEESFPDADDLVSLVWNHAELVFQLGEMGDEKKWERAALLYQKVVDLEPKGKRVDEAAFLAVVAWQNSVRRDPVPGSNGSTAVPLSARDSTMINAYLFYLERVPDAENVAKYSFNIGLIYYDYNHFAEAEPRFSYILEKHSTDPLAIYSAQYLLDIYALQKKYDALTNLAEKISKDPTLSKDAALVARANDIRLVSQNKQCEDKYQDRVWADAVACYSGLLNDFPANPNTLSIKFNLAFAAENAHLLGLAIEMRQQLAEDPSFNKTQQGIRSLFAIGRLYMQSGDYDKSASYFEKFANEFPGEPDAAYALYNAAALREALGDVDKAVDDYKRLSLLMSKSGGSKVEAAEAIFKVAEVRRRAGDSAKALSAYAQFIKDFGKASASRLILARGYSARILWADKKRPEALKQCKDVVEITDHHLAEAPDKIKVVDELGVALDVAAECRFYLLEEKFEAFQKVSVPAKATPEQLNAWIEEVKREREELSVSYLAIYEYGSKDWSLASLERIGELSLAILSAMGKAGLSAELSEPIKSDAVMSFSRCVEGSVQSRWPSEWASQCEAHLVELAPEAWPALTEWVIAPGGDIEIITAAKPVFAL